MVHSHNFRYCQLQYKLLLLLDLKCLLFLTLLATNYKMMRRQLNLLQQLFHCK